MHEHKYSAPVYSPAWDWLPCHDNNADRPGPFLTPTHAILGTRPASGRYTQQAMDMRMGLVLGTTQPTHRVPHNTVHQSSSVLCFFSVERFTGKETGRDRPAGADIVPLLTTCACISESLHMLHCR